MSSRPVPNQAADPHQAEALLRSRAFWGGVGLVAIWLSVLFVGVFGGNIVNTGVSGSYSSVPVVVVVVVVALLATMSVGHWALRPSRREEEARRSVEDERRPPERVTAPAEKRSWASLLISSAFWGGIGLAAIWLSVLFVGVFGGNIVKINPGAGGSSTPVVVVVAVAALLATMSVGRTAFRPSRREQKLRRSAAPERTTAQPSG